MMVTIRGTSCCTAFCCCMFCRTAWKAIGWQPGQLLKLNVPVIERESPPRTIVAAILASPESSHPGASLVLLTSPSEWLPARCRPSNPAWRVVFCGLFRAIVNSRPDWVMSNASGWELVSWPTHGEFESELESRSTFQGPATEMGGFRFAPTRRSPTRARRGMPTSPRYVNTKLRLLMWGLFVSYSKSSSALPAVSAE